MEMDGFIIYPQPLPFYLYYTPNMLTYQTIQKFDKRPPDDDDGLLSTLFTGLIHQYCKKYFILIIFFNFNSMGTHVESNVMKSFRNNLRCWNSRAACSRLRSNSRALFPSTLDTDDVQVSLLVDASRKLPVLNGSWIRGQANSAIICLQTFRMFDTPVQWSRGWLTDPRMQWTPRNFWPGVKRPGRKLRVYFNQTPC